MAQSEADGPADATDDQLKKRARRRLVGAIALVLLAVIVLPMVMDHEPRPASPDIQVRIPSQDDRHFEAKMAPAKPAKGSVGSAAMPPRDEGGKPEPDNMVRPAAVAPPPAAETPKETTLKAEVAKEAKPEPVAEAKPEVAVANAKTAQAADAERAKAALSGQAAAGNHSWVVQLGAYRESGNVKLLMAKIKEMGLPVYAEKFDSPQGPRTRVRAGPFPNREAAQKAQIRIKSIGVDGPVAEK